MSAAIGLWPQCVCYLMNWRSYKSALNDCIEAAKCGDTAPGEDEEARAPHQNWE
jgi:hypothetical protein